MTTDAQPIALAAAAHPDDIEFMMAGTLLRLREAGFAIHMWNLANGCCGTATHSRERIIRIRQAEAEAAATLAGATHHAALFDDLAIFYDAPSLACVAARLRSIAPDVVLTHAPMEYMEDHQNVCRLMVTAAFSRGMINFTSDPPMPALDKPVAIYHALPHGLRTGMGQALTPDFVVDITPAMAVKKAMLACHTSQREWLDHSQGMGAYVQDMESMATTVARQWGDGMAYAEGWLRHHPLGFAPSGYDPLSNLTPKQGDG